MKKYVELEALLQEIDNERERLIALGMFGAEHILTHNARRIIENTSAADVVEVVRCEECYKRYKSWCPLYGGHMGSDMDDDFYCKFGERRKDV